MYHIFFIHSSVDEQMFMLFRLRSCSDYCKSCCSERWLHVSFGIMVFFGYMFRIGIAGSYGTSIFSFFKETLCCYGTVRNLHRGCTNTFPPIVYEGSLYSTTSAAFSSCRFFDDGHSDRCEVIPQCGFDLHFNN